MGRGRPGERPRRLARRVLVTITSAGFAVAEQNPVFEDNSDSVAVVIGKKNYRQTVSVDFAHNDADAIKEYLLRFLGFPKSNVMVVKDVTLSELLQIFGSKRSPRGR
jgi:hypothetical protein